MLDIDRISIIPTSHLDLFWLGDYRNCLTRGDALIRRYLDRAEESGDETFVIDTAIFAEHFLRTHPHYEPLVRKLIAENRLEIGGAYIDRWENLVLGESLIRNIQIGRRWVRDRLGVETRLAAHPDLPGLNAQTAQIYAQAGVRYYVTSRKIFHEGRIWRHVAPDGTPLHMITWPVHYVFVPFRPGAIEPEGSGHFVADHSLSHDELRERYPHGTVAMAGGAGDLTGPEDFITRYGKDQRAYVQQFRTEFPEIEVDYAVPSTVMQPYLDDPVDLPERDGSFPSVWGVAPDEEMRFFHRVRMLERDLLDAETSAVIAAAGGRAAVPESAARWRGVYGEDSFFEPDDFAPVGREFEWLWRMQAFTQDHNGGGQDGALSVFQKKVRHDRARGYAREVVEHVAAGDDAERLLVLSTRFGDDPVLTVDPEDVGPLTGLLEEVPAGRRQELHHADRSTSVAVTAHVPDGIGLHALVTREPEGCVDVVDEPGRVVLTSAGLRVVVSKTDGTVELAADGPAVRALELPYAVRELGNDVTLRTDESVRVDALLTGVEVLSTGPLCAQVAIGWDLLDVRWHQVLTVWAHEPSLDVEVDVEWPALEDWQVRMPVVPRAPRDTVRYGTPFHGSDWEDVPEGSRPFQPDEIAPEDQQSYREVQHWLTAQEGELTLAVLTEHPAWRSADGETSAVLLRTAPSCGDPRMHWTNPGRTTWQLRLQVVGHAGEAARLADRRWRRARLVAGGAVPTTVLENAGDDVRVSAFYVDDDGRPCVRLVNQSDRLARVSLAGDLARDGAELVDLDDTVLGVVEAREGRLPVELSPWRIQTLRLRARRTEGTR
ncbi:MULTISPECIES: glycoside hydrolase family 38 N-terminal domain-containing protein [unclassified Isoptericola]|uniref:glycoside hydrolase family 38 N-terminal domain-containing protein n=1 Tax=unclassified Isoptericola TaxID=2623355 RepID=UPI00364D62D3